MGGSKGKRKTAPRSMKDIRDAEERHDKEAIEMVHSIAVLIGRAVSLSCVAALAKPTVEDHAIEHMDAAWKAVADKLIEFAMDDD